MTNLERITCKAALLNPERTEIILVEYGENDFGLPGGHIEANESPDEAMMRELREELDIASPSLDLKSAWRHPNGKLILGYVGIVEEDAPFTIDASEIRSAQFIEIKKIAAGKITAGTYDKFILQFAIE